MSGGTNQRTLFQTWGASVSQNKTIQPPQNGKKASEVSRPRPPSSKTAKPVATTPRASLWTEFGHTSENSGKTEDILQENEDDDDELMVVAVYEAEKSLQLGNRLEVDSCAAVDEATLPPPSSATQTYPDFPDFDSSSAKVWIYPTNYPIRNYQLKISEAALFQNTLVCLPTGLGKTFIASVVMYNFYRWYPSGKIVFMAPTKPLVAQQIEACYKVMGIPQTHMAELTGSTAAKQRQEVWRSKRVFFLTPQVMVNDLSRDTCPATQVKCVVIDEAHKALGNHAYCQVIRQLSSQTLQFRVLALSATPGGDAKSVQAVISNLLISHIELRSEESLDIQAHSHQRSVDKVVVPLGEALSAYQTRYLEVLKKFMSRLVQNRVMSQKDLRSLSKYQLILARDQFRKNPPPHIKSPQQGMLEGDFALCISLYHGYELLMQMGLRSLFFYVQGIMDGSREMSRTKNELQRTPTFMDLYREMEAMFVKPSADEPFVYSHPKLKKLEEVVLQHFRVWAESASDNHGPQGVSTRVMIFSSFRESVQEIAAMLNRHSPLIRVMTFMGQASAGKGVKGFTQKEQLEVVQRFRQGGFNTLVSTCVGEEGLDIGEVDLIVCFDAQKNPIRLVQRMGRTGRKRQGRIVVVLAEGREERTYNQSQSNKRSVYKSITGNKNGFHMYPNSPRMLPEGLNPSLHKMYITCGQFDHRESSRRSGRGRRSHSEGRGSLIHPQSLSERLFHSYWNIFENADKHKHPHRELSLWEWRHWQHKALPSHLVDHSLRCRHFVQVMELIDGMKDENELTCSDKPGKDETLKVILANVAELLCRSPPSLGDISDAELMPPSPKPLHPPFFVSFSLDVDDDDDELICEANIATFGQNKTLAIEEIGEKAAGVSACSPTWDEVFEDQVTFVDNITDDDMKQTHTRAIGNEEGGMNEENGRREMRSDEVLLNVTDGADGASQMDDSMELFEDDKAFLQMTIPDIPTPPEGNVRYAEPLQMQDPTNSCGTSPLPESTHRLNTVDTKDAASTEQRTSAFVAEGRRDYAQTPVGNNLISHSPNKTPDHLKCLSMQVTPEPLKISNDLFSVNFDLGLSLESSDDEAEVDAAPAPHATASPPPEKQTSLPSVSDSSTPYNSLSRLCSESRSSKPQRPSGREALLSPITPTRPRQALTPGSCSLKRKRTELMDSPPQPGLSHRRQFLDEEAELSEDEEGAGVSSDEEDGEDQDRSLEGFVVDNTHYSQELNDSEMQGVYLKSVRSPAVQGKFKMSYRNQNNMDIFSQVPEMDETYAEDSFVVGSDVEEPDSDEEEDEGVELLPEASYVGGRKQYATRRRVFLHRAKAAAAAAEMESPPRQRTTTGSKRSRVIRVQDSSEDEPEEREETGLIIRGSAVPLLPNGAQKEPSEENILVKNIHNLQPCEIECLLCRRQQRIESQHLLSDQLDFVSKVPFSSPKPSQESSNFFVHSFSFFFLQAHTAALPEPQASSSTDSPAPPASVSILVDSRCIGGAVELLTSLRQRHAATVLVCSLDASYFIVSNRMAVEKHGQSDLAAMQNRKRLAERVNSLQRLFERVCLIVEKDRTKAGEASRPFQRTHYYDRTLAALVRSGIRLLWSDGAEDTAALLVDLAKLEHRKGHGITVPLEVKGQHREQALQLYSSLPSVNYAQALNLSHNFRSIAQLVNSSVESIQKGGCMSGTRAEEIFRFLRYSCDSSLIKTSKAGKNS
uniref:Fanconi anemia group M protein n=1 Tax=Oryzias sinensis TaxID=183150 RepID=A0A8C7ZIY3_9TELE